MIQKKDSKRLLFERLHSGNYKTCYKVAKKLEDKKKAKNLQ